MLTSMVLVMVLLFVTMFIVRRKQLNNKSNFFGNYRTYDRGNVRKLLYSIWTILASFFRFEIERRHFRYAGKFEGDRRLTASDFGLLNAVVEHSKKRQLVLDRRNEKSNQVRFLTCDVTSISLKSIDFKSESLPISALGDNPSTAIKKIPSCLITQRWLLLLPNRTARFRRSAKKRTNYCRRHRTPPLPFCRLATVIG